MAQEMRHYLFVFKAIPVFFNRALWTIQPLFRLFVLLWFGSLFLSLSAYDIPTQDYRVRRGDTLYSLARRYGVSVNEIMHINELESSTELKQGMLLKIPARDFPGQGKRSEASTQSAYSAHVVVRGETLYAIARQYAMPLDELLELNGMGLDTVLKQGQTLVVRSLVANKYKDRDESDFDSTNALPDGAYWPVAGRREMLKGKLEGVRILARDRSLVYAVRDGKVMWQGPYRSYGVVTLVVSHDDYVYLYGGNVHFLVNIGQDIRKGDPLGKVDSEVENQLNGQSQIYQGPNQQLARANRYPNQVYFSVFRNGQFVPIREAPR